MHELENVTTTIGERIRFLRQTIHKVTQQELADATGISRGNLSNYEKDRFKPASDAILSIANYFNVSTDWLLTGNEPLKSKTNIYNPDNNSMVLSDREIELITLFRKLKDKDKLKIEGMLELKLSEYDTLNK